MIYIECNNDEVMVKALGIARKDFRHTPSKGNVCNNLEKSFNSIGLVDEDPKEIIANVYLRQLEKNFEYSSLDIILYSDNKRNNKIISLLPNLECWIIEVSKEVNIDLSNYHLPNTEKQLHSIGTNKKKLKNLEEFIKESRKKSKMLKTLEMLIKS